MGVNDGGKDRTFPMCNDKGTKAKASRQEQPKGKDKDNAITITCDRVSL